MPIYKQTTEITNIDDLLSSVERDIEEVYFGDKNVFTVWGEYEGTLPATFNANGANMRQYQIYGANGGAGDKTKNILDESTLLKGFYDRSNGEIILNPISQGSTVYRSFRQSLVPGTYTVSFGNAVYLARVIVDDVISENVDENISSYTVTTQTGDIGFSMRRAASSQTPWNNNPTMLTEGSTVPASYVPFGYEVDMSVSDGTTSTTTPIYIGDDPLEKVGNYSDYVDYELQKVVRAIKKYVLTGEESWEEITGAFASRTYFRWVFGTLNYCVRHVCTCSHFTQTNITTATTIVGFDVFDSTSVNGEVLAIRPSGVQSTTLEDFKAWLAEQYAAGTPITVWCALTVAEEADPPVALPALPTCEGETIIDYAGQSQAVPEKAILKYRKENF